MLLLLRRLVELASLFLCQVVAWVKLLLLAAAKNSMRALS
jgi:hypothetical protein